jgi:hypothetical protein
MKVWNSLTNQAQDATQLALGRYYINANGSCVEKPVQASDTLIAAEALVDSGVGVRATSQAQLIVLAQQHQVAFTDWDKLTLA